jgi:hypothetical protein
LSVAANHFAGSIVGALKTIFYRNIFLNRLRGLGFGGFAFALWRRLDFGLLLFCLLPYFMRSFLSHSFLQRHISAFVMPVEAAALAEL